MNRTHACLAALLCLPLAAGCLDSGARQATADTAGTPDADTSSSKDVASTPDTTTTPDTTAVPDATTGPGTVYTAAAGPFPAAPGEEKTLCVNVNLGNTEPVILREVRTHLSPGSHHMIVSRRNEVGPVGVPEKCGAFSLGEGGGEVVFIAQKPEDVLVYPPEAGLPMGVNQQVRIEIHYFNYYPDAIDVDALVDFVVVPASEAPDLAEIEVLFTGELSLYIPAHSDSTHSSFHKIKPGARVFALTSHTHQLGTRATLHRAFSKDQPGELLHESTSWSEPPLDTFDPPLVFGSGEGLLLTCEFTNPTDDDVHFGLGFEDEMCFLWAHIYTP